MRKELLAKSFGWMFLGLIVTFLTGYLVLLNESQLAINFGSRIWVILALVQIGMVILLHYLVPKLNTFWGILLFLLYSVMSGLTFQTIFIEYNVLSVISIFLITAILFGIMALLGVNLKFNFNKYTSYLLIALIGILIISLVNLIILHHPILDTVLSIAMLCVFFISTVSYIQNINNNNYYTNMPENRAAILFAFGLYLDFIIIFSRILRLTKKIKN